jgi:hypothetical protein
LAVNLKFRPAAGGGAASATAVAGGGGQPFKGREGEGKERRKEDLEVPVNNWGFPTPLLYLL